MSILAEMVAEGFVRVGRLTAQRPELKKLRKHGIYFEGEAPKSRGVYILVEGLEIVKVGETRGGKWPSKSHRLLFVQFRKTNERIRHASKVQEYLILFRCTGRKSGICRDESDSESGTPFLEKELLLKIERSIGVKPRLNPVSK